jgi:4,5-DOPA dioxygenase extradiol
MPLLGDPAHAALTASLVALPHRLGLAAAPPAAVLLVSAHYEKAHPTVLAHPPERLIYDYGGFPEAAYKLQYRPPGAPHVADAVMHLLG